MTTSIRSRTHSWPKGHWNWPIKVTHKHGLRDGEMIHVGGQVDLDPVGNVLHQGNLAAQTKAVVGHIGKVLGELGADLADVVKLTAFYVNDGSGDEQAFLADIGRLLPAGARPVITAVPLPALAYAGMVVEIEAVAMRAADGKRIERTTVDVPGLAKLPEPFAHALRAGEMIYTSGLSADLASGSMHAPGDLIEQSRFVMERIGDALATFGADHQDAVKINIFYTGGGTFEDWQGAARVRAAFYEEPGPAATGIPVPRQADPDNRTRIEITAMRGLDGKRLPRTHVWPKDHWDWPIHLPYKHGLKCGSKIFIGGQVALTPKGEVIKPDDMVAQTRIAMEMIRRVLEGFGAGFDDVVKVLSCYEGKASAEVLHDNLSIRSACFTEPGPASTGVPFPALAYEGMVIEIDIYAIKH